MVCSTDLCEDNQELEQSVEFVRVCDSYGWQNEEQREGRVEMKGARLCRDTEDNFGVYRGELAEDNDGSCSQRSNWSLGGRFASTYDCVLSLMRLSLALS